MALPKSQHLDLRDPALRAQHGLRREHHESTETISIQTPFRRVRRQYRSRVVLAMLVCDALSNALYPLSRREIANAIGVSKNAHLLDVIAELVAAGRVVEQESDWHGIPMFVYEVA